MRLASVSYIPNSNSYCKICFGELKSDLDKDRKKCYNCHIKEMEMEIKNVLPEKPRKDNTN